MVAAVRYGASPAAVIAARLGMRPRRRTPPCEWRGRCPVHAGTSGDSLSVKEGDDGRALVHCFAGCDAEAIIARAGMGWADVFADRSEPLPWIAPGPHRAGHGGGAGLGPVVAEYLYRNPDRSVRFRVTRHDPKTFRPWHLDAAGQWALGMGEAEPVLYRLPELLDADPGEPMLIAEGEKDVDRLRAHGFVATCNPGGALKWRAEYGTVLTARHVVILPDDDAPGLQHAEQVARYLDGVAASVKVILL